jgi:hypothetical protein
MSFNNGPTIVTNGLVLALDAGDRNSYPGSGTTWRDLSGNNNNGTLTNGPTFNSANLGSIVFDGVDDYVTRTASINTGQNFTFNSWFRTTNTGRRALFANSYPYSSNQGWYFFIQANNSVSFSIGNDQAVAVSNINLISTNVWYNISAAVTNGGSDIKIYLNGILQTNNTSIFTSIPISYSTTNYKIGALLYPGFNDYFGGNISSVQIYNRTLSPTEILQNYTAMKTRFGL